MHHPTDRIKHTTAFVTPVMEHWLEREIAFWKLLPLVRMSRSSQCSTTGVTKAAVCVILSGMMHIKEPLLLLGKSSLCGGSGFPLSLSELRFTICPTPYNRK